LSPRRVLVSGALALIVSVAACGSDKPDAAGDGLNNTQPYCATANAGCDCDVPGRVVDCGNVELETDDYVTCSAGKRTCNAATHKWTSCIGDRIVTKSIRPLGLAGTPSGCTDPCDPYCRQFLDDTDGGVPVDGGLSGEGGISIAGGAGPGTLSTTVDGTSQCSPNNNVISGTCNAANQFTSCQQDFRCDTTAGTCAWNGASGIRDNTCAGVDLTMGAPCVPAGSPGSVAPIIPLCNRGTVAVPAASAIKFHLTNPPGAPDGCTVPPGAPWCTYSLPTPLAAGQCINVTGCPAPGPGQKYLTVNWGQPIAECGAGATARCHNNAAYYKTDGSPGCGDCGVCNTRVSGKVYDPTGPAGNNVTLADVQVFQPSSSLTPFVDGVACDTCLSLSTPYTTITQTANDGSFTLSGVTPGPNVPIVVQSGRWRRMVYVNVKACVDNNATSAPAIPNGTFRMPANRADFPAGGSADIPKIALATGALESMECLLAKFGITSTGANREFAARSVVGTSPPERIHLFANVGGIGTSNATGAATPGLGATGVSSSNLVTNTALLNEYAAIMAPCEGASTPGTFWTNLSSPANPTNRNRLVAWADAGGRIFADHLSGDSIVRDIPAWAGTASWYVGHSSQSPAVLPATGKVLTTTTQGTNFLAWLTANGAFAASPYNSPFLRIDEARIGPVNVNTASGAVELIRGENGNNWGTNPAGDLSYGYVYDTPLASSAKCGRVIMNNMHASDNRVSGGSPSGKQFPGNCSLAAALGAEEKALEYQFFRLTSCQGPAPSPLVSQTFVRDYQGVCAVGEQVTWRLFSWQATVPTGTNIAFRAATATTQGALPASPPGAAPTTVPIGSATVTTTPAGTWFSDANTVDWHLKNEPPGPAQTSKSWLRVYMTLNPAGGSSPTLTTWRQEYSCVPVE
jgi:hypothetical protein